MDDVGGHVPANPLEYDYDTIEEGYYDRVYHRRKGIQSKWHHLKFKHVTRAMPANYEQHLDVACGPGTFAGSLTSGGHTVGVDIAEAQIAYAQARYADATHSFQQITPGNLPFDDETFDVVTMVELIEHLEVEVIRSLFAEALRVLKPGGKLVVTTPNYASLWPILEKFVNRLSEVSYEDQHITFFHRTMLRNFLSDAGFAPCRVSTFQGAAPFTAVLGWAIPDAIQRLENPLLIPFGGFLLLGEGYKPS